jgi:RecA-family ATPase
MTPSDQARNYLFKGNVDPSISGQDGHGQAFKVACTLIQQFGLSIDDARPIFSEWNRTCQPPWSDREIEHKLKQAEKEPSPPEGRGYRVKASRGLKHLFGDSEAPTPIKVPEKPKSVAKTYDLNAEAEIPGPMADGTRRLLRAAFLPGEAVRICVATGNYEGKEIPEGTGHTFSLEEWLSRLDEGDGNPNSFLSSRDARTKQRYGIYVGMNPLRPGGSKDDDVTAYRHALLEWDDVSKREQWNLITQSNIPVTAVIDSGGKSLHAWVKVDAKDRNEYKERVAVLYDHFNGSKRPDDKNKNPARLSRLAGCERGKGRQELIATNIGASGFTEWLQGVQNDDLGPCLTLGELWPMDAKRDPNCILGFNTKGESLRYLCKGKGGWIIGPSGVGKSSLTAELAIGWALGLPVFGIAPARPLKTLIIQAENDDMDLAEMVQGVLRAHDITPDFDPEEKFNQVKANVLYKTESTCVGAAFADRMHRLIDRERPDIVIPDPLLSFAGIDVSSQEQVSHFLRGLINPVLEATGCVMLGLHHSGKLKHGKDQQPQTPLEYAYAGLGSSELVNWARAVMTLMPLPGSDGLYALMLAKRGNRAGAKHPDGEFTTTVYLQHSKGEIRWTQVVPPDGEDEPKGKKTSEPKLKKAEIIAGANLHSFLAACKPEGETQNEIAGRLESWLCDHSNRQNIPQQAFGTKLRTCHDCVSENLLQNGKLEKKIQGKNALYFKGQNA